MIIWLFMRLTMAASSGAAPVIETLEAGHIDWSAMILQVTARSDRTVGAWKDRRVQEQDALNRLEPLLFEDALRVRFSPDTRVADLETTAPTIGNVKVRNIEERLQDWRVQETRYRSGGGVEMDGAISLHAWLKPTLIARAAGKAQPPAPDGPTGVLIDARPLAFRPCIAPEIQLADETTIYDATRITTETAKTLTPVVYVTDPVDPAAGKRAGNQPLFLSAEASAQDCMLRLSKADSTRLRNNTNLAGLLATAKVVIVLSP